MLILRRKERENIIIQHGDDIIRVLVLDHQDGVFHIGVDAPENVKVDREEVYYKNLRKENRK